MTLGYKVCSVAEKDGTVVGKEEYMQGVPEVKIQIDRPVLSATTRCTKGFFCLSGHSDCICWPTYASRYPFVEIRPKSIGPCSYLLHYGNSDYCLCPTRNAIYHRYHL